MHLKSKQVAGSRQQKKRDMKLTNKSRLDCLIPLISIIPYTAIFFFGTKDKTKLENWYPWQYALVSIFFLAMFCVVLRTQQGF